MRRASRSTGPHPSPGRAYMGRTGLICHFSRALPASVWGHGHRSQVLAFGAHTQKKGCDNDTFRAVFRERKISPKLFRPKFLHARPRGMSVPQCLFFQDLEGLTEVLGGMSAGMSCRKLPLWAEFSFVLFLDILGLPQTLQQNEGRRKMTNRPCFASPPTPPPSPPGAVHSFSLEERVRTLQ